MKDRKFIYAIIYFLIGLFCLVWGLIVYMSYPHLIEIMKNAFKAAWIQYVVGFACFMISLYLAKDKK